jgi:hypothetical protein
MYQISIQQAFINPENNIYDSLLEINTVLTAVWLVTSCVGESQFLSPSMDPA